jgi:hypothetical protein
MPSTVSRLAAHSARSRSHYLLQYVAEQLEIQTDDIEQYFQRQPTRSDHLQEIIDLCGFQSWSKEIEAELVAWMRSQMHRWSTPSGLCMQTVEELRRRRVILPAISLIEHLAWRAYREAEQEVFARLTTPVSVLQISQIDDLLMPAIEPDDRTLSWLRRAVGAPGAKGALDLMDRIDEVRAIELHSDWGEGIGQQC